MQSGAEAMGWTLCALAVAGRRRRARTRPVHRRFGATCVLAAVILLGVAIPSGNRIFAIGCAFLLGGGFGLFWSFAAQRIFSSLREEERTLGASAVPAVQIVGNAFGAAVSGTIANLLGMTAGMNLVTTQRIGTWLFFWHGAAGTRRSSSAPKDWHPARLNEDMPRKDSIAVHFRDCETRFHAIIAPEHWGADGADNEMRL